MARPQKGFKVDLTQIGSDYRYNRCPECGEIVELYPHYYICRNAPECDASFKYLPNGNIRFIRHSGRAGLSPNPSQIKAQCRQIIEAKREQGILHKQGALQNLIRRMAG